MIWPCRRQRKPSRVLAHHVARSAVFPLRAVHLLLRNARLRARRSVLALPSAYLGEAEDRVGEEIEAEPPWPSPPWPPGYRGDVDPLDVFFSQSTCAGKFQALPVGGGLDQVLDFAKALSDGTLDAGKVKRLHIHWFRHRYYSLDNRRLAAFRLFRLLRDDAKVPVIVLDRSQALRQGWSRKFNTGFTGGQKIRIRQTNEFVGLTREQSTFGHSLWS